MAKTEEAMGKKPDGRLYSRIMRRCVVLLKHIRVGRQFDLTEVAEEVHDAEYPEFSTRRELKSAQIKPERVRDYLSYLVDLEVLHSAGKQHTLNFKKPSTDEHWAQALSDIARVHLSKMLGTQTGKLPSRLEDIRKGLHEKGRVPTVAAVIREGGIESNRREEEFRWSLYLYTDGDASPVEIRQYPHLIPKSVKETNNV